MASEEETGLDVEALYDQRMAEAGLTEEDVTDDKVSSQDTTKVTQVETDPNKPGTDVKPVPADKETKPETKEVSEEDIKSVLDSTAEADAGQQAVTEPESVIDSLVPKETQQEQVNQEQEQRVPLDQHIKLRQRAQQAEQERDELREKMKTQTDGEKSGELSPLEKFIEENPDDEFIPPKIQLEDRKWQEARERERNEARIKVEQAEKEASESQQQLANSITAIKEQSKKSEAEFRKTNTDYASVTKPIIAAGLLKDSEIYDIFNSENPAGKLYEKCKAKADSLRNLLGVNTQASTAQSTENKDSTKTQTNKVTKKTETTETEATETEATDDDLTDEQLVEEVYARE